VVQMRLVKPVGSVSIDRLNAYRLDIILSRKEVAPIRKHTSVVFVNKFS
jgi:hypothetical protein